MVDQPTKFVRRLDAKQSKRVRVAVNKILTNNLAKLDVKPLQGHKGWYRCRVGKIRIIFVKTSTGHNIIHTIDFRGGVYK